MGAGGYNAPSGEMTEQWVSLKDAATLTGYSQKQIRRLVDAEKVVGRLFADVWQIDIESLRAYVSQMKDEGAKRGPKPKP